MKWFDASARSVRTEVTVGYYSCVYYVRSLMFSHSKMRTVDLVSLSANAEIQSDEIMCISLYLVANKLITIR